MNKQIDSLRMRASRVWGREVLLGDDGGLELAQLHANARKLNRIIPSLFAKLKLDHCLWRNRAAQPRNTECTQEKMRGWNG